MKKFYSEKNIAAILFIMVLVIFSFAHEYSKKRDHHYNVSVPVINASNTSASVIIVKENNVSASKQ